MKLPKIHWLFLTTIPILGLGGWATPVDADPPRFDSAWKHFDTERSPLQKGLLDARDKKWRKNIKLGSDPRCARVVRMYARHPDRSPKLCVDLGLDEAKQIDMCVRAFCCENPSGDLATCRTSPAVGPPETECNGLDDDDDRTIDDGACIDGGDEAIVACARALIGGVLQTIKQECTLTKRARTTRLDGPDDEPTTCAEVIFSLDLPGRQGQRYLDCLEDPFRECPGGDPECDPEIKGNCKHIFKELEEEGGGACIDLPIVVPDVPSNRGRFSVIKNSSGRTVGKRIQTRTVIHYDVTGQRRSADDTGTVAEDENSWDRIRISKFQKNRGLAPGRGQRADSVLSSSAFNLDCDPAVYCPANEDRDCYDKVTGEHYRGDQCFDGVNLRETLKDLSGPCPIEGESVCCEHDGVPDQGIVGTGEVLYGADCELRTTLVQMIDEDPPDVLNNDGDCYLENTQYQGLTSDCVLPDGNLRAGYMWNVNEEGSCNGTNNDNDCMGLVEGETRARIGMIDSGRCVDGFTGETIGEVLDEDYVALIDEDCEDRIDNDGDGLFDEDGEGIASPQTTAVALGGKAALLRAEQDACTAFYHKVGEETGVDGLAPEGDELPDGENGCDFTRAMRVHVNHKMRENSAKYQTFVAATASQKFFHADSHGRWCGQEGANEDDCTEVGAVHPENPHKPRASGGNRKYKYEKQKVTVDEVFSIKCKRVKVRDDQAPSGWAWVPTYYDEETGLCVTDTAATSKVAARGALQTGGRTGTRPGAQSVVSTGVLSARPDAMVPAMADGGNSPCEPPYCDRAMMGFTFAPPVIEWGWRIQVEVCIFGFCFDIFYARVGYEFSLAAGLRLPIEIHFEGDEEDGIQDWLDGEDNDGDGRIDEVLAEESFSLKTKVQPMDFSVADYEAFCREHHLDDPWYIANCRERFSFPDFLDPTDGDEFVAQYSIWAGIIVKVLEIPLINWSVGSSMDVPAACTMFKILSGLEGMSWEDMYYLVTDLASADDPQGVLQALKDNLGNCGSFTTPFGLDEDEYLRGFPFLEFSRSIRADCFDALINGEVVTINGQPVPICTGIILGTAGASLGIGLGIDATAGSRLITADDWSTSGDAEGGGGELEYEQSKNERWVTPTVVGPTTADNYVATDDYAHVELNDLTYYLNAIQIKLSANLEFGGILSPIPDIGSFTLYNLILDAGHYGIPIPQHPGTEPAGVSLFVENYGLDANEPIKVEPAQTQDVQPGCLTESSDPEQLCPEHRFTVVNVGSVTDSFDNFRFDLSNWRQEQLPKDCTYKFLVDPNNDHDCIVNGVWHRGDPFDGEDDPCYDRCGNAKPGALIDEDGDGCPTPPCIYSLDGNANEDGDDLVDEDPADSAYPWTARWDSANPIIENVGAHSESTQAVGLRVSPSGHFTTAPGIYKFRVWADSVGAKTVKVGGLAPNDPLGNYRINAPKIVAIEVQEFYDPRIFVLPEAAAKKPGSGKVYEAQGVNGGNVPDSMSIVTSYLDFNQAGCTLVTLGHDLGCPYRAVPTAIPSNWLVGAPPDRFPAPPPPPDAELLQPGGPDSSRFSIQVPGDWAGMGNTTYRFVLEATSEKDPAEPPATSAFEVEHTVIATLESRTLYIGLEIQELIDEIRRANDEDIRTGGALPIALHPVQMTNQRALDRILAGDPDRAIGAHSANIHLTEAFIFALDGVSGRGTRIPEEYYTDWMARANAIIADLNLTVQLGAESAQSGRSTQYPSDGRRVGRSFGTTGAKFPASDPR